MRFALVSLCVLAASSLVGCNDDGRVAALDQRLVALEAANKELREAVQRLEFQIDMAGWDRIAFLQPGDEGYSVLRYDLGVVTVKIADVKPYANGSKISLQFGNLTSAKVNGLKATLEWGKVDAQGLPLNKTAKSREVTFGESLPPGAWTLSEIVLDGVPPIDLGFVRLKEVGHRGVGMHR